MDVRQHPSHPPPPALSTSSSSSSSQHPFSARTDPSPHYGRPPYPLPHARSPPTTVSAYGDHHRSHSQSHLPQSQSQEPLQPQPPQPTQPTQPPSQPRRGRTASHHRHPSDSSFYAPSRSAYPSPADIASTNSPASSHPSSSHHHRHPSASNHHHRVRHPSAPVNLPSASPSSLNHAMPPHSASPPPPPSMQGHNNSGPGPNGPNGPSGPGGPLPPGHHATHPHNSYALPPPRVGPGSSSAFGSSRELPSLSSLTRGNSSGVPMSISSMLGGPSHSREPSLSSQPGPGQGPHGPPGPPSGPGSAYAPSIHASPRIQSAANDYGPYRRPQTPPEHQRPPYDRDPRDLRDPRDIRDVRDSRGPGSGIGASPQQGSMYATTPEMQRYGTPQQAYALQQQQQQQQQRGPHPPPPPPGPADQSRMAASISRPSSQPKAYPRNGAGSGDPMADSMYGRRDDPQHRGPHPPQQLEYSPGGYKYDDHQQHPQQHQQHPMHAQHGQQQHPQHPQQPQQNQHPQHPQHVQHSQLPQHSPHMQHPQHPQHPSHPQHVQHPSQQGPDHNMQYMNEMERKREQDWIRESQQREWEHRERERERDQAMRERDRRDGRQAPLTGPPPPPMPPTWSRAPYDQQALRPPYDHSIGPVDYALPPSSTPSHNNQATHAPPSHPQSQYPQGPPGPHTIHQDRYRPNSIPPTPHHEASRGGPDPYESPDRLRGNLGQAPLPPSQQQQQNQSRYSVPPRTRPIDDALPPPPSIAYSGGGAQGNNAPGAPLPYDSPHARNRAPLPGSLSTGTPASAPASAGGPPGGLAGPPGITVNSHDEPPHDIPADHPVHKLLAIQDINRRNGRISPLPQAVQGAQSQIHRPSGEPSIKNEFGRMYAGIGNGVGMALSSSITAGAGLQGLTAPPSSAPAADEEPPAARPTKGKRRKVMPQNIPRSTAQPSMASPLLHQSAQMPTQAGAGSQLKLQNGNSAPFTPPAAPQPGPAPAMVKHKQVVRSDAVISSVAHLPREYLGDVVYDPKLKPARKNDPLTGRPPRFPYATTPRPLPIGMVRDKANSILTVKISKVFLEAAAREEITYRRALWGSDIYTDDSDVIAACIHGGWIRGEWPEDIDVSLLGLTEQAEARDGTTKDKDSGPGSRKRAAAAAAASLASAEEQYKQLASGVFTVPPKSGPMGIPADRDLHVTLLILPTLLKYSATTRFGIRSREWGKSSSSSTSALLHEQHEQDENYDPLPETSPLGHQLHDGMSFKVLKIRWVENGAGAQSRLRGAGRRERMRHALARTVEVDSAPPLPVPKGPLLATGGVYGRAPAGKDSDAGADTGATARAEQEPSGVAALITDKADDPDTTMTDGGMEE
ncbi:histone deacetylation protein rxt3 [Ophiostoma piceae UAMH 11346]|uniref:Histone deacetylation protein rxt3 n=1 Tax=Ophiostoma piceae (strain UAMH 11346) TaxID=1262450 RepID=S3BP50_OPHP1|nr:histone deacetylation protein rxt3 [Ophiostoma piceae UAMH 11346]